jgi:DNA invertase Pin-like site-specific DNA recombinase
MKAVYIRTSTEDQEPENQIKDIETISGREYQLFQDKQSAWKDDKERTDFETLKRLILNRKIEELYVWDWDRLFRNRKRLKEFFQFCSIYKCNIHSYRQKFYEDLYKVPSPFNEIMQNIVLDLLGWMAEDESLKKSGRVKNAVRRVEGKPTMSYKGNKWGRKTLSTQKINKIIELSKVVPKLCLRAIAEQSGASIGSVHKIMSEITREKVSELNIQNMSN